MPRKILRRYRLSFRLMEIRHQVKPLSRLSRLFMYKILQKQIFKENICIQLG